MSFLVRQERKKKENEGELIATFKPNWLFSGSGLWFGHRLTIINADTNEICTIESVVV